MIAGSIDRRTEAEATPRAESAAALNLAGIYAEHFRYVWRCLRSLGVRDAQLEDSLQDVFIVVQRRLPEFDGGAELRTWLYAIALRVARKYRERARRDPESLEAAREHTPELPAAPDANVDNAASREQLELAHRALSALDDDKREVFVLARVEQMSAPEIAGVLGLPLNTVYSRFRAARLAFEAEVSRLRASTRKKP